MKSPGLYFDSGLLTADLDQLRTRGLDVDSVALALAESLKAVPGVTRVYTCADASRFLGVRRNALAAQHCPMICPGCSAPH